MPRNTSPYNDNPPAYDEVMELNTPPPSYKKATSPPSYEEVLREKKQEAFF
ncbi:hypothetical protein [Wolbachia endosymbiont of Ctenocephalides felis wCfeT]|uniref:hypothetical protein n=1 Tax=Wolbachia endosymbiont of Ctenocephalides felis wCfeT TaxID=2732593 RepID=UPI0014471558|nr:hypothetical protein [Wolbachia endosymbiont of Ctenocephalides felis wCfeT]